MPVDDTPPAGQKRSRARKTVKNPIDRALEEVPEEIMGSSDGSSGDGGKDTDLLALAGDEPGREQDTVSDEELDDTLLEQLDGMHAEEDRPPELATEWPHPIGHAPKPIAISPGADPDEGDGPTPDSASPPAVVAAPRRAASGWFVLDNDNVIRGWCIDRARPEQPLTIAILIDGVVVGEALANRLQAQLREDGHGDGRFAFAFAVPPEYQDGEGHELAAMVVTPGYQASRLKIKHPMFSLSFQAAEPIVSLRSASLDGIEGVLTGRHFRQELDVWLDGTRLDHDEVSVEWTWSARDERPFRVRFPGATLGEWLGGGFRIAYPGVGEAWNGGVDPADLLTIAVNPLGGSDYEVVIGPDVSFPDDTPLHIAILAEEPDDTLLGRRDLPLHDNAVVLTLDDDEIREWMRLRLSIDGRPLGTDLTFAHASLSRRMLPNGGLERWDESGPEGFAVPGGITPERGFYAFPAAIKNQYLLSGALFVSPIGEEERVLLALPLARTAGLGSEQVQLGLGFFARASRPVAFGLRLVDEHGTRHDLLASVVGGRWKSDWRTVDFHRPDGEPSPLTFEVTARSLDEDDEPNVIEIAGLHCGEPDVGTFADALEAPDRREHFASGDNLIVNADLLSWPAGLAFGDRRSRFEVAEGWNLFNRRASAEIEVAAVPAPTGERGRYALSVAIPSIPEYCRLEVALDCQDLGGQGRLRFDARCRDLPTPNGETYTPDRWSFIDRIYLLKRDTREEGGRLTTRDTVVANVARRVVVTREWEENRFDFSAMPAGDGEFDLARDNDDYVEYLLIFEFRRPIALVIHGVSVRFGGKPGIHDGAPLLMEDRNIRAQVGVVRGIDDWNARTVLRPAVFPPAGESPAHAAPERWSWKHAALGTVDIGICVYNAADETLECLRSLVGSSGVPHTVRIVNDGSDEDTRQRIATFVADKPWMTLIDNDGNRGYTHSANRAVLESDADWVILLNSDTIVSRGWIEGLLEVAASDPNTAFVGAVSNAATYQSVPELYDAAGKWAVNQLPRGHAPADMAAFVATHSGRHFPEAPLLNGFCTLIRRRIFAEVGGLNEQAFPAGYGEENDLCLRVRKAGYVLRIADHVYVYHSKSASFGTARRTELAKAGDKALRAIHQDVDLGALGRDFLETPALVELRATIRAAYAPTEMAPASTTIGGDR